MKILNEEHFEDVKRYAESIGDTSLQKCLERLKSWEGNPDYPSEISQGQSGFSSQLFNRSRHFWSEVSPMDSA